MNPKIIAKKARNLLDRYNSLSVGKNIPEPAKDRIYNELVDARDQCRMCNSDATDQVIDSLEAAILMIRGGLR